MTTSILKSFIHFAYRESKYAYPVGQKDLLKLKLNLKIDLPINKRGVFIDGGAFDGCSVIKFKLANPNFDCISFEPNPALWKYFHNIPTLLIKKGIASLNKSEAFKIDYIDGDGSSLIPTKKIIHNSNLDDSKVETIYIDCVNISEVIVELDKKYDFIVLKLDVEGAEYEILEHLISRNLISKLDQLYVEFHWKKCNFSEQRHNELVSKLVQLIEFKDWDALDFAVHRRGRIIQFRRYLTLKKYFSITKQEI
jgi:FkbM family methyltransferase